MEGRVAKVVARLDEFIEKQNAMAATLSTILMTVKDLTTKLRQHRREQLPPMFVERQPPQQTPNIVPEVAHSEALGAALDEVFVRLQPIELPHQDRPHLPRRRMNALHHQGEALLRAHLVAVEPDHRWLQILEVFRHEARGDGQGVSFVSRRSLVGGWNLSGCLNGIERVCVGMKMRGGTTGSLPMLHPGPDPGGGHYEAWLVEHRKTYDALGEKERRFEIFKDNLSYIDEQNAMPDRSYKLGLNRFADLTDDEYRTTLLGTRLNGESSTRLTSGKTDRYEPKVGESLSDSIYWGEKEEWCGERGQKMKREEGTMQTKRGKRKTKRKRKKRKKTKKRGKKK